MEACISSGDARRARARNATRLIATNAVPVLLGASLAIGTHAWSERRIEFEPGTVAAWIVDRDAQALVGLDADAFVSARIDVEHPVEVEARPGGGAWVASALDAHPLGAHRVLAFDGNGELAAHVDCEAILDLATLDDDAVWVERAADGRNRVRRASASGSVRDLDRIAEARCVAGRARFALVGTARGELCLIDADGRTGCIARSTLGGRFDDVAPGPDLESWWALDTSRGERLFLLDDDLEARWSTPLGLRARFLAPVPHEEQMWLFDAESSIARRYGPRGRIELSKTPLALAGITRGAAQRDGGCWLVAPGAALRLDSRGDSVPGQGGFDFLVDAAVVAEP